jgi:hypothetical protein
MTTRKTNWLKAQHLKQLIKNPRNVHQALLQIYKNEKQYPGWTRTTNGQALYLNTDKINEFCALFHFELISSDNQGEQWLSAEDISKLVVNKTPESINKLLKDLKNILPICIISKTEGNKVKFFLDKNYLNHFCKKAHIILANTDEALIRTKEWVTIKHLQRFIRNGFEYTDHIRSALLTYCDTRPDIAGYKLVRPCVKMLCLRSDFIQEFCHNNNLEYMYKTSDWLSVGEIADKMPYSRPSIRTILEQYKDKMPNIIQTKQTYNGYMLCVHKQHLNKIQEIIEQELEDNTPAQKPIIWLAKNKLVQMIRGAQGDYDIINAPLIDLYNKPNRPDWIRRTSAKRYVIRADHLQEFCDLYGLRPCYNLVNKRTSKIIEADQSNTKISNDNVDNWITKTELRNLIIDGIKNRTKLHQALITLFNRPDHNDWVRKTTSRRYIFNKKHLTEFCTINNFELCDAPITRQKRHSPDLRKKDIKKTLNQWLNATEVRQQIMNGSDLRHKIHDALIDVCHRPDCRNWIKQLSTKRVLFNKVYLDEFCKQYGFERYTVFDKSIHWLTPSEIVHSFSVTPKQNKTLILVAAKDLYAKGTHPDWIYKISAQRYLLNAEHIQEIGKMYGFCIENIEGERTEEWLTPTEIKQTTKTVLSTRQITKLLEKHKSAIPEVIQRRRKGLCLHRDHLERFCALADFTIDTTWLGSQRLSNMLNIPNEEILHILKAYQNKYPDVIQTRKLRRYPCLCLRADSVNLIKKCQQELKQTYTNNLINLLKIALNHKENVGR